MLTFITLTSANRFFVAAESTGSASDPYSFLINYGALGIILVLIATGQFRTKAEVQRLEEQVRRVEEQNKEYRDIIRALQMQLTNHTIPAMSKSAQVLEAIPDKELAMFEELKTTQAETKKILDRLEKLSRPKGG